jgi:hypothetical protein
MKKENYVVHMVWKDKQAVVMLSTHAEALEPPGSKLFVCRKMRGGGKENMYRSDADQLHGVYSYLTRSHKWWHRLFFYMLDTTICNM